MNKKKKMALISAAILGSLLLIGGIVFLLFFWKDREVIAKAENTYDVTYQSFCTYEHDEQMKIDGVLDESEWEGKNWFTNTYPTNTNGKMPTLKVTGFATKYGVYIASVAEDTNIINDGQRSPRANSNWELYVAASNVGEERSNDGLYTNQFNIDMIGDSYSKQTNFERAVVVDGELNSGATKSATLEVFIPWELLYIDTSKGIPTEFRILPAYRAMFEGQTETQLLMSTQFANKVIADYYRFNANGYVTQDREGAVVGDNKFGYAKSANWDISKEEQGIVQSSFGAAYHKIFFKDAYGDNFIVEATIIPVKGLDGEQYPKTGILFEGTDSVYHSVSFDMAESNLVNGPNGTKNLAQYKLVTLDNQDGGWNQNVLTEWDQANGNASKKEGVKLTVIKYGGKFWYFADNKFIGAEVKAFMEIDAIPGFFTLGGDAIYKDYSCTVIDEEALKSYLNERGLYLINAQVGSAGGSVTASDTTVKKGGSYDITITSTSGYEVSSVLVNGVEKIKDVKKNAVDGVYTISGAKENQEIKVSFAKIDGSTFKGVVRNSDGAITGKITLMGTTNKALRYEMTVAGEKGGTVVVPAGSYKVLVEAKNHKSVESTIKIEGEISKEYTLIATEFPETVTVNGKTLTSSLDKWDISEEHLGKVSGSYADGTKMAPLYLSKTGSDFVMEATIKYATSFQGGKEYQPDLMGGFIFHDGTNHGWIMARQTGVASTGWKFKNNLIDYSVLTYPEKKTANFAVAKVGEDVYIYFDGENVAKMKWSEVAPDINAKSEVALGFYMVADKTADIEFSNYKVQVGTSVVNKYVANHTLKDGVAAQNAMFATALTVNDKQIKSALKKWDLSEAGAVKGSFAMGSKLQPLYFAKQGSTALIQTTIEYTTNFVDGESYQPDLMGGICFSDGTNTGWLLANQKGLVYTGWKFQRNLVEDAVLTYPEKRSVKLTVAVKDNYIYVFMDDVFVLKRSVSVVVPNVADNANLAFGLTMVADKTADIKFSNTSISTDKNEVNAYISTYK